MGAFLIVNSEGKKNCIILELLTFISVTGVVIFIVEKGRLITPELTSCLEGITRSTVFTLAKEVGIEVEEKRITRDQVYIAEEAFFTGTAAEVLPIKELDSRRIGEGKRGPITEKLQDRKSVV